MLDGVIYRYTPGTEEELWVKPKQVPQDKIVGWIDGCWMKKIRYKLKGDKVNHWTSSQDQADSERTGALYSILIFWP